MNCARRLRRKRVEKEQKYKFLKKLNSFNNSVCVMKIGKN